MRNILGIDTYMEQILPEDIEVYLYEENELEKINYQDIIEAVEQLEKYCILKAKTNIWSSKPVSVFKVVNKKLRDNMQTETLKTYYFCLRDYYKKTVNVISTKKLSKRQEEKLSDLDYLLYLKSLRIRDELSKLNNLSLEEREKKNPHLRKIMKASRIMSLINVRVLNDEIPKTIGNRPIIYVLTHVGRDDQIVFSETIKGHYTVLSGDYESLHNNIAGLISMVNGILYFDMRSKKERSEINDRIVNVINKGDNILCSMEGVWNASPNRIVLDLFPGLIEVARKTNAVILPVGIERFSSKFFGLNVSKEYFDPNVYFKDDNNTIDTAKNYIKELMEIAKFEIYFDPIVSKKITTTRKSIGDYEEYRKEFVESILKGWTFTEDALIDKSYRDRKNPIYAYDYLVKKYENLYNLEEKISCGKYSIYEVEIFKKIYYRKLAELLGDIKNNVYPNNIHNSLVEIYDNLEMDKKITKKLS